MRLQSQKLRAAIHRRAEYGLHAVKLERGAGIGNFRATENKSDTRSIFSRGVSGAQLRHRISRGLARRKSGEGFAHLLFVFGNHGNAPRKVRSSGVGGEAHIREVVFGMFREMFFEAARHVLDRSLCSRGKRQDVIRADRQSLGTKSCRRFLNNHVGIRAAESKTAYAREAAFRARPWLDLS